MSFKEHLRSVLSSYFIIAALINLAIFILGKIFRPDDRFGYEAFLSPLIYAAVALIPMLCMYSKKELSPRQHIAREFLQLISIEMILIFFGLGSKSLSPENLPLTASFALSVFVIYVLVHLIGLLLDMNQAKKLNSDLKAFQNRFSDNAE